MVRHALIPGTLAIVLLLALPASPVTPAPADEPYTIEDTYEGFIEWSYAYQAEVPTQGCVPIFPGLGPVPSSTCGNSVSAYSVHFRGLIQTVGDDTKTLIFELDWQPNGPLGEYLELVTFCADAESPNAPDPAHPCYVRAEKMTPSIQIRYDEEHWQEHGTTRRSAGSGASHPGTACSAPTP